MENNNHNQATVQDVLIAINDFSNRVDRRFELVDNRFEAIDNRFETIDKRFEAIDKRFEIIEEDVRGIKNQMVTKDYLDNKLADLRADFGGLVRREDVKVNEVIETLENKKVIDNLESGKLKNLGPYVKV